MASTRAHTEPEVLRWARETSGLPLVDAASRIGVQPSVLELAERGEHQLTLRQVELAARAYSRPIAALFMPEPIEEPEPSTRHRRLPGSPPLPWSPAMRALTRLIDQRQQDVAAILEQLDEEPQWKYTAKRIKTVASDDVESLALSVRSMMGFSVEEQQAIGWGSQYVALNHWIDAVESLGVVVTQSSTFDLGESRGFVSPAAPVPLVVLNSGERFVPARIFSLLHELGHLIEDLVPRDADVGEERWCNVFAGAITMPREQFLAAYDVEKRSSRELRDAVRGLSRRFVISQTAVALRAGELGLATEFEVDRVIDELRASRVDFDSPRSGGSGNYHYNNFAKLGPTLTRITFGAMDTGQISQAEASRILATKVENFDQLRDRLASRVVPA